MATLFDPLGYKVGEVRRANLGLMCQVTFDASGCAIYYAATDSENGIAAVVGAEGEPYCVVCADKSRRYACYLSDTMQPYGDLSLDPNEKFAVHRIMKTETETVRSVVSGTIQRFWQGKYSLGYILYDREPDHFEILTGAWPVISPIDTHPKVI